MRDVVCKNCVMIMFSIFILNYESIRCVDMIKNGTLIHMHRNSDKHVYWNDYVRFIVHGIFIIKWGKS